MPRKSSPRSLRAQCDQRGRHEELCELLRAHYDVEIRFQDFLPTFDDEASAAQSIMPLELAELQPSDRMMIVTCDYQLIDRTHDHVDLDDRFVLAGESVGFHLIAALAAQT